MRIGNLPDGWAWTTVDQLSKNIQYGYTESANLEPIGPKFLRITDIQDGRVDWETVPFCKCSDDGYEKYRLEPGDIVFARTGATTGKSFLIQNTPDAVFASYLIRLRLQDEVNRKYFSYFLDSPDYWSQIMTVRKGSAQPGVNAAILAKLNVPLPPLPEQERIVAKIEELFMQLEAGTAALKRVQAGLKRYKASVLKAAVEGRLSGVSAQDVREHDVRVHDVGEYDVGEHDAGEQDAGEHGVRAHGVRPLGEAASPPQAGRTPSAQTEGVLPDGWRWVKFGDIITILKNGFFYGRPSTEPIGIPILRISAVRPMSVNFDAPRYIPDVSEKDVKDYFLVKGDLLFTRYNGNKELVGACGLVGEIQQNVLYPDKLIRVRVNEQVVSPEYAQVYFATQIARHHIENRIKSTAGQHGIAGGDVKSIPFILPPLAEQRRIVAEVERRLEGTQEVESVVAASLARAGRLRQSVLKAAFEGRLG